MNDLFALAEQVRTHYLKALLGSLAEFKAKHSPSAPEVMFELQREGALPNRLYRADMAANVDGEAKLQDVNTSTHLSFEPFDLDLGGGLSATVQPFVWNDVGYHGKHPPPGRSRRMVGDAVARSGGQAHPRRERTGRPSFIQSLGTM